jgi:hypothetical protein
MKTEKPKKVCEHCRWYQWDGPGAAHPICNHRETLYFRPEFCRDDEEDPCGPKGKLWEPR